MTLPVGNPVVTGTVIESVWANNTMADLANEMTDSLSRSGKGGMLAALKNVDGTVTVPAYSYTSEFNSGWYLAGDGDHRLSIKGVDAFKQVEGTTWFIESGDYLFNGVGLELDGDDLYIGDKETGEKVITEGDVIIADNIRYSVIDNPLVSLPFTPNEIVRTLNGELSSTRLSGATYIDIYDWLKYSPAPAANNLALWSESFDDAVWVKANATISANSAISPTGEVSADSFIDDTSNTFHRIQQVAMNVTSGVIYTKSVMARDTGNGRFLQLSYSTTEFGTTKANFDLVNGIISSIQGTNASAEIELVSDGYYRVSFSCEAILSGANSSFFIYSVATFEAARAASYIGDGVSVFSIFGAQFEESRVANGYVKTEATSVTANSTFGIEQLRIEKDGALIEGAGDNEVLWSEDFSDAAWGKVDATITANSGLAPDGVMTADKITEGVATSAHRVNQNIVAAAGTYTGSLFAASDTGDRNIFLSLFDIDNATTMASAYFDIENGVIGSAAVGTASIQAVNGGYRLIVTGDNLGTQVRINCQLALGETANYQGNGTSGAYFWGADFKLDGLSSYIPTTSSSASRAADDVMGGVYNNVPNLLDEWTFITQLDTALIGQLNANITVFVFGDSLPQQRILLNEDGSLNLRDSTTSVFLLPAGTVKANDSELLMVTYDGTNAQAYYGDVVGTALPATMANPTGQFVVGNRPTVEEYLNGHVKYLGLYDKALNASEFEFYKSENS